MKELRIYGLLIDDKNKDRDYHFYAKADTEENKAVLCYLERGFLKEGTDVDEQIEKALNERPQYHLSVYASGLIRLVDTLNGIEIKNKEVNGEEALEMVKEGMLDEVASAILEKLRHSGNLLFLLPNLLNVLKDSYSTDLPLLEVIKTVLSEAGDLQKYDAVLYRVNEKNAKDVAEKL